MAPGTRKMCACSRRRWCPWRYSGDHMARTRNPTECLGRGVARPVHRNCLTQWIGLYHDGEVRHPRREAGDRTTVRADPHGAGPPWIQSHRDGVAETVTGPGDLAPGDTAVAGIINFVVSVASAPAEHGHAVLGGIDVRDAAKACHRGANRLACLQSPRARR